MTRSRIRTHCRHSCPMCSPAKAPKLHGGPNPPNERRKLQPEEGNPIDDVNLEWSMDNSDDVCPVCDNYIGPNALRHCNS